MDQRTKGLLHLQYFMGRLAVFILGPLLIVALKLMRYRIRNLGLQRAVVRSLLKEHSGPWIICPNHLTMIDSVILAYALAPLYRYMFRYRTLAWNLPEQENFQSNAFLAITCYLTKCIPVNRGGDREKMKKTLEKCTYLLSRGESIVVFPEGGRTRTGRVDMDNFSYGVGRLISKIPNCRVMCVYMRGDRQTAYSDIPQFGERFYQKISVMTPHLHDTGLKGQRDCAKQIVEHLARMENEYFETRGKRHRGSDRSTAERETSGFALYQ